MLRVAYLMVFKCNGLLKNFFEVDMNSKIKIKKKEKEKSTRLIVLIVLTVCGIVFKFVFILWQLFLFACLDFVLIKL